jgi:predicted unusual protein kinase regulating ubiquinone biosynthesis (AarF/ABC1/UbiB family)
MDVARLNPPVYDVATIEAVFRLKDVFQFQKSLPFLGRFLHILGFLTRVLFFMWWDEQIWTYLGESDIDVAQSQRRRKHARWMTEQVLAFGPTFIKVGQQISSRVDLIRKEVADEMAKLQDRVPPFPLEAVRQIFETELGQQPEALFASFDPVPLAAASLGQVHRAVLTSGEAAIVKVQRPNLEATFNLDLCILRKLARWFDKYTEFGRGRDWPYVIDEFGKTLFEEIDYLKEGRNADQFRKNFLVSDLGHLIHIPTIYWQHTTRRVIAMEYAPGIKISDVHALELKGFDTQQLAQNIIKAYFEQILVHGFYHADPHPGNLAVREDQVIIFYDFGMVGTIPDKSKRAIVDTFLNIVAKKPDQLLENLIELDMLAPNAELDVMRELLVWALDNYYDVPHDQLNFENLTDELAEVMYSHPFKLPPNITFMIRSLVTLEGIASALHPSIRLITAAVDYAQTFVGQAIDFNFVLKKGRELLGLPDLRSGAVTKVQRVRLQPDEWKPLARYIKAGFVLLGFGQIMLFVLIGVVLLLQTGQWNLTPLAWVLLGLGVGLVAVFTLLSLVLMPSRKLPIQFKAKR